MHAALEKSINIAEIIKNKSITAVFQPIISIKKKAVIGIEALCRGVCHNRIIMPDVLFSLAAEEGLTLALDRLCREKALSTLSRVNIELDELILFINFDTSIIDEGVVGSGHLLDMVNHYNFNPNNIAIEINESRANDIDSLKVFIETYRKHGFIIALDDVGKGYSNLNRVAITKPDIIKIDKALVRDISKEYYKQEVFRSLINLSRNIGALAVAEGVETEDEAIASLGYGVDMLQGYYFSRPQEINNLAKKTLHSSIEYVAGKFKDHSLRRLALENTRKDEYQAIMDSIIFDLEKSNKKRFTAILREIINHHQSIECIYILNQWGVQVSDSVCNQSILSVQKRPAFRPAPSGTDHSLKDYYYLLTVAGSEKYITEPYISLASGNLCTTISTYFEDSENSNFILCIDARSI